MKRSLVVVLAFAITSAFIFNGISAFAGIREDSDFYRKELFNKAPSVVQELVSAIKPSHPTQFPSHIVTIHGNRYAVGTMMGEHFEPGNWGLNFLRFRRTVAEIASSLATRFQSVNILMPGDPLPTQVSSLPDDLADFIGQNEFGIIIELKDGSPGFGSGDDIPRNGCPNTYAFFTFKQI